MMRSLYSTVLVCAALISGSFAAAQQKEPPRPPRPAEATSPARETWKRLSNGSAATALPGKSPAITFSTTSINFGNLPVGLTSTPTDVTITNTDAVNLTVSNEQITANFLIVSDTCVDATIVPNAACDIFVSFAPTATGVLNGTLTVTDNAAGSPQTVSLTGTGTAPTVLPSVLNFGKQIIGTTSAPQSVTVTNNGTTTINFTNITPTAGYAQTNTCGTSLGPESSCTINVSFAPTTLCNQAGTITVNDDVVGATVFFIFLNGSGASAGGLTTTDLSTLTPNNLVNSLLGSGVTASNTQYTGANVAAGSFSGGAGVLGLDTGIILSSGSISNVIGPNCSTAISTDNLLPGDVDLNTLVAPNTTNDAAVLEFDFVPASNSVSFQYVFSSDEYNEFANSPFNDVFGFFVNGQNVALLPGTTTIVSINNVNGGNPLGTNPQNPQFFINNDFQIPFTAPLNIEMDGLTVVLTVQAAVNAGQTNHIKLAIADTSDGVLDSNVFIKAGSFVSSSVTVTPSTLAFGNQVQNTTSAPKTVTVANNGATAISINTITATAGFTVTNHCPVAPSTLAAAATCTFDVAFSPTGAGAVAGTATVNDTDAGSPHFVTLSGTGVAGPTADFSPTSLVFGNQAQGTTSAAQDVTLTNNGTSALIISAIANGGTNPGDFAQTNTCGTLPAQVAADSSCVFHVTFKPTASGPRSATLVLTVNVAGNTQATVSLSGTGGAGAPAVSLSPTSLTFASQAVGGTSPVQTVTLTNTGSAPLTVTSVTPSGDFADTTTCVTGSPIAVNGTCTISVTFKPTAGGARSGAITIVDNAPGSPHTVGLTGSGTNFSLTVQSGTATTLTVNPGDTAIFFLTLSGNGGFTGTVGLGCTSSQASITCSVSPTSVTLTPGGSTVTAITLNTFCSWGTPRIPLPWDQLRGIPGLWLAAGLGLILLALTARKNRRVRIAVPIAMLVLLGFAGCSGGPSGPSGRTPAGTYNLTITATSQGVTQSTNVTLIVK